MKKIYPLFIFFLPIIFSHTTLAQCPGQSKVEILITPDAWPAEIHWSLHDGTSGVLIDTGNVASDTVCVPAGQCLTFNLHDDFGDGLLSGNVILKLDGVTQTTFSGNYGHLATHTFNCPPGTTCSSAILVTEGTFTAPSPDTWYRFIPDTTGNFTISTCGMGNNCDTRIYVYASCQGLQYDDVGLGVSFYSDNFCGLQSEVIAGLAESDEVIIRIGDSASDCAATTINWSIEFTGPIVGCMDPLSCTYNPLAEIPDTNMCVYTGPQCIAPDLAVDKNYLESSMYMDNFHNTGNCEVDEGCVLGYGVRKLLKYGVQIWNYGQQPYYVGDQQSNPTAFEFAPCHGHYHYKGFAESYLYNSSFQQVDFARKTSYAIINMQCLPGYSPGGPALAPGCSDIYSAGYSCQWVDVTNLDTGFYYLVLKVNSGHYADYLGHSEYYYGNNSTLVCFDLTEDSNGNKNFTLNNNCMPYVDCAGDTFGNHVMDCTGDCNGMRMKGDLNIDTALSIVDVNQYLDGIASNVMPATTCNELTGDNRITVYDAARLNACIRNNDSTHMHIGGNVGNHAHCNFPFGIENPFDTVTIGLLNPDTNFVDVNILNPRSYVLGFEFTLNGIKIDSVKNIAGNFNPVIRTDFDRHIVVLAEDEFSINKQTQPLSVLRVFFSNRTDSVVCVDEIIDVVNGNYERVAGKEGSCVLYQEAEQPAGIQNAFSHLQLQIVPNPSTGKFEITGFGALLQGAVAEVHNSLGQLMYTEIVTESNNRFNIDLTGAAKGVYILTLSLEGHRVNKRITVVR